MFSSVLLSPIGISGSDTVEAISRLLYGNSCILTVTTFIACGLLLIFIIWGTVDAIIRSKKERKSDD